MTPRHLLDTNILSDLGRHPLGIVAARLAEAGEEKACTSIVVAAELRLGAVKSGSKKPAYWVDLILSALEILPLGTPADRHYGDLCHHLTRQGYPLGLVIF